MSIKRILILTNLPQRDMATDQILAAKFRERDCDVRTANYLPRCRDHILFYKPDIVIGPEARCEFTIAFYKQCKEWGIYTVAKRTEPGGCWNSWNAAGEEERKTIIGGWPYEIDLEIVWAEEFREIMIKHGYLPKEKIFVAGNMSLDPYFYPPFHAHPENRKNIILAPGWGHADRGRDYNIPEAPPGSSLHSDAFDRHRKGRESWIDMIRKLREVLGPKGWEFFLRLKCGEMPNEYALKLPGIKFIMPCETKMALLNGDMLVHAGSMMALEADLCSIPAFSYFGSLNQTVGWAYPHISPDFEKAEDLLEAITKAEPGKSNANRDSIDLLAQQFYGAADGKGCERVVNKVMEFPPSVLRIPDEWPADTPRYASGDVYAEAEQWVCETCRHPVIIPGPIGTHDMVKCPWCGISLARCKPALPLTIHNGTMT